MVVGGFANVIGFDRDRAFYPTVLIVIASYYVLFALMGEAQYPRLLFAEIAAGLLFLLLAVLGFKTSMWLVAGGVAAHGLFRLSCSPSSSHEYRHASVVARLLWLDRSRDWRVARGTAVDKTQGLGAGRRRLPDQCYGSWKSDHTER